MAFSNYEELKAAVANRRKDILTLEIDLGGAYSQEHEDAKKELNTAKAMKAMMGGQGFLGGDNIDQLELKVEQTKPEPNLIWAQFHRLGLDEWSKLIATAGLDAIGQYERVLPQTFIGLYGTDPVEPDDAPDGWEKPEPLTTDASSMSSRSPNGILPGGGVHSVVQAFMAWQNSGGDVNIRPTKSGLV